jgi:hypothetical protein
VVLSGWQMTPTEAILRGRGWEHKEGSHGYQVHGPILAISIAPLTSGVEVLPANMWTTVGTNQVHLGPSYAQHDAIRE